MNNTKYVVKFLHDGKTKTIVLSSEDLTLFYQNKLSDVNIISVKKTTRAGSGSIKQYCKPQKSIFF